ncbi:bifunctional proline dehydrogenase/L-glutamate gamma-semialdehyde dehydrogenase PutA [Herbaspirillum sp. RTI4]|uniref:bifunctional proline dehydrogenase/L-glutamate gamma-semialdehyde dehydrogenase PutA n=1 Tax=Herbaspirillum sp. RTI4 TaxID=3048640 RepID=UPI002AB49F9A|nr:bifunctional proline dehydrogenase/L-glutamate gamma-semialdehyde dehydrogenase PutA [Herbaspirillum sp. RTI4]MDY7577136.1 bifunctional proline dehydrogenase/L-glutamate gamma-semialdehyde dehydrogenase PutA [Herbaspirillum sp. RTI4]MEA9980426.1 bifunctional proline dehydrogenase/L-glutamate gamma-semialdehyde dehydrogenase PutA [Herbaspirillum sp. RTI4]
MSLPTLSSPSPSDTAAEFVGGSPPFSEFHAEIEHAPTPVRAAISAAYRCSEQEAVRWLLTQTESDAAQQRSSTDLARRLVQAVRARRVGASGVDALMQEFSLSSEEGVALMCLAEALLRIPDRKTADRLIADQLGKGDWRKHLGASPSLFVNAASWGLLISGKLVAPPSDNRLAAAATSLIGRGGALVIRKGVDFAMRLLGRQFVTGQTIEEALANSLHQEQRGYRYSYDMLGEAALTAQDADDYFDSYEQAIHAIGQASAGRGIRQGPGISVKLSALHPRYARAQRARVMEELLPRLKALLVLAKQYDIGLNIDAEEADRLELSLDLIEALAHDADLAVYDGLGIVVQAYQKRCPFVIDYLLDLARRSGRKFMVRLVKGAYWDSEIKRAQMDGMNAYPVYTRKVYTDVSYLVCAQKLLASGGLVYPQFATHNAHTVAAIHTHAKKLGVNDYEFQCLHGMGETLYDQVVGADALNKPCRIYAPVGSHQTLLPYLVRRLLENGANSSFVNQIVDPKVDIDTLIADPRQVAAELDGIAHSQIPLPSALYGESRKNSAGLDLSSEASLRKLSREFAIGPQRWHAEPLLAEAVNVGGSIRKILNPADKYDTVGHAIDASDEDVALALRYAAWPETSVAERARQLDAAADLFEQHTSELLALAVREAGKSLPNAIAEVREAVDFLRYYAARILVQPPAQPLGIVVCISPWNFPLAIFVGQVSAALAAGNAVLAKPAEQTPLIAQRAVALLHQAGVPRSALQFLPGPGETIGAALVADARVQGVIFTGSGAVARSIERTLAERSVSAVSGDEPVLIAETGGQNVMIVDSSALPEQVVQDVLQSAFDSAGQRCSALRVLCLQEESAERILTMLKGAMQQLCIGNPNRLATDVGPVIDEEARAGLLAHIERMRAGGADIYQLALNEHHADGCFVAPTLIEIDNLAQLQEEVFGPVLHVLRYRAGEQMDLVRQINASGYGLTLGIHTRIARNAAEISDAAHVGNIYINRNMVGATVGVQPFGGEGRSGTGPKAGGPLYLSRLQRQSAVALGNLAHDSLGYERRETAPSAERDGLYEWASQAGRESLLALLRHYQMLSVCHASISLRGPTGETNTLSFAPRGKLACIAVTPGVLLNQIAAALACDNLPVLDERSAALLPTDLLTLLNKALHIVPSIEAHTELQLALVEAPLAVEWRKKLAQRDGALVPLIAVAAEIPIPLWRLVAERALCTNTAAAGGNASLMSLSV